MPRHIGDRRIGCRRLGRAGAGVGATSRHTVLSLTTTSNWRRSRDRETYCRRLDIINTFNCCLLTIASTQHVRRTLPALLPAAAALPQMGLYQQARILLQHHCWLRGADYGGYGSADQEIYGRGAEAEDSVDLPRYVTRREELIERTHKRRTTYRMGFLVAEAWSRRIDTGETDG
jgi:hypothetical protein